MSDSQKRPNVIWLFGDQHRGQATGYAGDPNVNTPNLDRLAAQGVNLPNAVGGCPLCSPYRGSLLTSRYPHDAVPGHDMPMPDGMPTVADAFNDAGYRTAWFGKWHVDGLANRGDAPSGSTHVVARQRRGGFQTWLGYENNNSQWRCYVHGHDESDDEIDTYCLPTYETDALTDLALDYIGRRADDGEPFFCGISVQPPHNPYVSPEQWQGRHTPGQITLRPNVPDIPRVSDRARRELAGYYAMIENIDWNLGRLRDKLETLGILDDTHILFFSDHGDMHGSHGQFLKTNPYEESIRVPCVFGGRTPRYDGAILPHPMNHVDFAPTSLGLCGITPPTDMAGTDYSALRRDGAELPAYPDSAFLQLVVPTGHPDSTDRPWRGIVTTDGWKYVCLEHQPWLMFNLNEDRFEQANLAHNLVGSSRVDLQACKLEYSIVSPK